MLPGDAYQEGGDEENEQDESLFFEEYLLEKGECLGGQKDAGECRHDGEGDKEGESEDGQERS